MDKWSTEAQKKYLQYKEWVGPELFSTEELWYYLGRAQKTRSLREVYNLPDWLIEVLCDELLLRA